jgi:hypothetical protein
MRLRKVEYEEDVVPYVVGRELVLHGLKASQLETYRRELVAEDDDARVMLA